MKLAVLVTLLGSTVSNAAEITLRAPCDSDPVPATITLAAGDVWSSPRTTSLAIEVE